MPGIRENQETDFSRLSQSTGCLVDTRPDWVLTGLCVSADILHNRDTYWLQAGNLYSVCRIHYKKKQDRGCHSKGHNSGEEKRCMKGGGAR